MTAPRIKWNKGDAYLGNMPTRVAAVRQNGTWRASIYLPGSNLPPYMQVFSNEDEAKAAIELAVRLWFDLASGKVAA